VSTREILAGAILALFALRWVEYFALRTKTSSDKVLAKKNTIMTLLFGSAVWLTAGAEALLHSWEPVWVLSGAGGALYLLRFSLKLWAIRTLGAGWSTEIEIRDGHRLVRNGPYRWVRHPIYLCNILEPVAVAMIANGWVAALLGSLLMWPTLFVRLRREEIALRSHFREDYESYRRDVPALIPWKLPSREVPAPRS